MSCMAMWVRTCSHLEGPRTAGAAHALTHHAMHQKTHVHLLHAAVVAVQGVLRGCSALDSGTPRGTALMLGGMLRVCH